MSGGGFPYAGWAVGEAILHIVIKQARATPADVVHALTGGQSSDPRPIHHRIRRIINAGLLERVEDNGPAYLRPTDRGLVVNEILHHCTAARGGTFKPWSRAGIEWHEGHALKHTATS